MIITDAEKLLQLIPPPHRANLLSIAEKMTAAGFECFLVGGSVRDLVRNKIPDEYDLATSATPQDVKKIFNRVIETGIEHGTVTVRWKGESYEVTTYRIDKDYEDGRRPVAVEFGVSLSEDLRRRDFTMNALALDLLKLQVVDEHNGISDIAAKTIRTIGNPLQRFSEDGLRPVRAIRFMSSLGFQIEKETYAAIYQTRDVTAKVSVERFHDEINKIFRSAKAATGLAHLLGNKMFELFIQEPFDPPDTPEDLYKIDHVQSGILGVKIAYFFHLILKHQPDKIKESERILKKLKYSRQNIKDTLLFLQLIGQVEQLAGMSDYQIRKNLLSKMQVFSEKDEKSYAELKQAFYSLLQAIQPPSSGSREKMERADAASSALSLSALALNGNTIMENFPAMAKPLLGEYLGECLDFVFAYPEKNTREELLFFLANRDIVS